MVEFTIGNSIKSKIDKLLVASKAEAIEKFLTEKEQGLYSAIKKQTIDDKIKAYNIGDYTVFVAIIKTNPSSLEWQQLGGYAYKAMQKCREVKVQLTNAFSEDIYDFSLGLDMASYRFDKYFTKKPESFYPKLEKVIYINTKLENFDGYKHNAGLANAIRYARDLINEPANELSPEIYAADIKRLEYLGLEIEILHDAEMKEKGFGLANAVAQGSVNRPCIAIIKWRGDKTKDDFKLGLVGKGVTFDSGGLSLKTGSSMAGMKQDMAGSAVVVSAMKSIALQKVEKNIVAVVGLVENMPSGNSYRPDDILKSLSGQTVEINNTDAEGRLVLADCLTYIQQTYQVEYLVDVATLTGAISIALADVYAGLFSNTVTFANQLCSYGEYVGERLWRMPIGKEFDKMIDSSIADMKNTGGRAGGSSTAACFLQRFVNKNVKWAHLDIAGVDTSDGNNVLYPKGASAFGVKLLNHLIHKI